MKALFLFIFLIGTSIYGQEGPLDVIPTQVDASEQSESPIPMGRVGKNNFFISAGMGLHYEDLSFRGTGDYRLGQRPWRHQHNLGFSFPIQLGYVSRTDIRVYGGAKAIFQVELLAGFEVDVFTSADSGSRKYSYLQYSPTIELSFGLGNRINNDWAYNIYLTGLKVGFPFYSGSTPLTHRYQDFISVDTTFLLPLSFSFIHSSGFVVGTKFEITFKYSDGPDWYTSLLGGLGGGGYVFFGFMIGK